MRNWVFDIQRFATDDTANFTSTLSITGPAAGSSAYYTKDGRTITNGGASGTKVVKVDVNDDGEYTLTYGTLTNTDFSTTSVGKITLTSLHITAPTSASALSYAPTTSEDTDGAVNISAKGTFTATSGYGGTISNDTVTYKAVNGTAATMVLTGDATTSYLTAGSVVLDSTYTGKLKKSIKYGNEVLTIGDTGSLTVDYNGKISGLSANTQFKTGDDATPANGYIYKVGNYGENIVVTNGTAAGDTSSKAGTYILTTAIGSTTVQLSGSTSIDTISGALFAKSTGIDTSTLTATGVTAGTKAILGSTDGTVYAYRKDGAVIYTGRQSTEFGTFLAEIKADNEGIYTFNAANSTIGETIAGAAANLIRNVVGGSGDDNFDFLTNAATNAVTINAGAGNDTIQTSAVSGSSLVGGAGNDSIVVGATTGSEVTVDLGDGKNTFEVTAAGGGNNWTVKGGAGADVIDTTNVTGTEWLIDAGDGGNTVNVVGTVTYSTVKAGSGNDTITSASATNTLVGGGGKNVYVFNTDAVRANISDYSFGNDSLRLTAADEDAIATAIDGYVKNSQLTTEGVIDATDKATISSSAGFYAVTFDNANKNKVNLGWTTDNAANINASSLTSKNMLVGITNTEGDLLVGGTKADTIYAGTGDSVYGGAGTDSIKIGSAAGAAQYGVYVGLSSAGGADTVTGFTTGFDIDSADAVYFMDSSADNLTISNDKANVTLKSGKGTLDLKDAGSASGNDAAKLLVGDKKVYSISNGGTLTVASSDDLADYYFGTTASAIALTGYEDAVNVDLSNAAFRNISSVTGGASDTTLMGSKAAESLVGGTGASSLYGGAGKDTLTSGAGVTTFFITTGAGKDSVTNFATGTNEETSDVLNIFNAGLTGISRSGDNVFTLKVSDTDTLQVTQATSGINEKIQWVSGAAKGVAKIGYTSQANNFAYDSEVTNYLGGSKNDTVNFGSGNDDVNVWLDQTGAYSSIDTFDARSKSGDVLIAGSSTASETLMGGSGSSSLWGGTGNQKDVLVGNTSGTTNFFYGMGQGSDSISGGYNDTVNLYDMQLSDLASANIDTANRRVIITTKAGDTVTVSGGVQNFNVGGTTYQTSYASSTDWTAKA